jgi:hypothetical protein
VPAPEPGKPTALFIRKEPGPFGDLPVWRLEGGTRAGEEFACLPSQIEDMGYEIVGGPVSDVGAAAGRTARPLAPGRALVKTLAIEKEARSALAEGRRAMKRLGIEGGEEAEHPALVVYDRLYGDRAIYYKPGESERGTEIAELLPGRRALRREFTRNRKGADIDQVVETVNRELGGGAATGGTRADLSIDDFLDLLAARAERRAGKVSGDTALELRQMADAVDGPEPKLAERLRAAADDVESEVAGRGRGERQAIKEYPAEIERRQAAEAARREAETAARAKAEEARVAAQGRTAAEEGRTAAEQRAALEAVGAETEIERLEKEKTGLTLAVRTAEAAGEIKLRNELKDQWIGLKAAHAQTDENGELFLKAVRRLPIHVRGKLFARGIHVKTVADRIAAMELADKYYEDSLKGLAIDGLKRTAGLFAGHRKEFDPSDEYSRQILSEAFRVGKLGREDLKGEPLDSLENSLARLEMEWGRHQRERMVLTAEGQADAEWVGREILGDMHKRTGKPLVTPPAGATMPQTLQAGWLKKLFREWQSHPDTIIESLLGDEGGAASKVFVEEPGFVGTRKYARWVVEGERAANAAAVSATGGDLHSESFIRWFTKPLTIELPSLGKVTAERRYWIGWYLTLRDDDAMARIYGGKEWPGFVWETAKGGGMKPLRPVALDFTAFRDHMAAEEGAAVRFGEALADDLNRPERFAAMDETFNRLFGLHLVKVPGNRWGLHFNVLSERPGIVPDVVVQSSQEVMKKFGRTIERLPPGRTLSYIVRDPLAQFYDEVYGDAAYVGFAIPIRNGFTVLRGTTLGLGGERPPVTLAVHLAENLGRSVPDYLLENLAHIMSSRRLAPNLLHDMSEPERAAARVIDAGAKAVISWKITPMINQIPNVVTAMADTRPMALGDWLKGFSLVDPATFRAAWADLRRLAPELELREEIVGAMGILNPSTYTHTGYSRLAVLRRLRKAVDTGMKGVTFFDTCVRVHNYLAFLEQAAREGLTGEAAKQRAADLAVRMMYRADAPQNPAYESLVGRAAKRSWLIKAFTLFTQGVNAQWNMIRRAATQYAKDKNAGALAWRLTILLGIVPLAYTAIQRARDFVFRGGQPSKKPTTWAGDYAENAIGGIYGASLAYNLVRGQGGYGGGIRPTPAMTAVERTGQGLSDLRKAITESDPKAARRGALRLLRGSTALAGIPTDQAFQLARMVEGVQTGGQPRPRAAGQGRRPRGAGRARRPARTPRPRTLREMFARGRNKRRFQVPGSRFQVTKRTRPRTIREWIERARAKRRGTGNGERGTGTEYVST